jgi:hypothetical protein
VEDQGEYMKSSPPTTLLSAEAGGDFELFQGKNPLPYHEKQVMGLSPLAPVLQACNLPAGGLIGEIILAQFTPLPKMNLFGIQVRISIFNFIQRQYLFPFNDSGHGNYLSTLIDRRI